MASRYHWTLGLRMPSRLYPTLMLKIIPGRVPGQPSLWCRAWIRTQARRYSSKDSWALSSCDHSTLYPFVGDVDAGLVDVELVERLDGLELDQPRTTSQAVMMFWAICVWGPAATPNGVSISTPYSRRRKRWSGRGRRTPTGER